MVLNFNTLLSYKPDEDGSVFISLLLLGYVCVLCWKLFERCWKLFERKDAAPLLEEALSYWGGGNGTLSGECPLCVLHSTTMTWCKFSYYLSKTCIIGHKCYIFLYNYSTIYPNRLWSMVALYWDGISIKAARANSVSFRFESTFFDIISVKFTNYTQSKFKIFTFLHNNKIWMSKANRYMDIGDVKPESCQRLELECYHQTLSSYPMAHLQLQPTLSIVDTRCNLMSIKPKSNPGWNNHWPDFTYYPTNFELSRSFSSRKQGKYYETYLAFTIASIVFFSCELSLPFSVSTLLVTYGKFPVSIFSILA